MSILRLILLSLTTAPVFVGFSIPFAIPGVSGLLIGFALILSGAALTWFAEHRSRKFLDVDNRLNRILKADGENLLSAESDTDKPSR